MSVAVGATYSSAPAGTNDHVAVASLGAADDPSDEQSLVGELGDSEDDEDGDDALIRDHLTPVRMATAARLPNLHPATTQRRTPSDRLDRPPRS